MVGRRILYALALAGAALFFLFYEAWISLFTLVLVLALPVVSLALSLPLARKLRPELLPPEGPVVREGEAALTFRLEPPGGLAVGRLTGRLVLLNALTGGKWTRTIRLRCDGSPLEVPFPLPTGHCGMLTFRLERLRVLDLLGIFALPVPLSAPDGEVPVLPKYRPAGPIPPVLGHAGRSLGLRPKPGGGPAEDYDLRDYRPGDPMRTVHWKLSSKRDELVVREMLEPRRAALVLTVDHFGPPEELDEALDRLQALSLALLGRAEGHLIAWVHPVSGAATLCPVDDRAGLHKALSRFLREEAPGTGRSALDVPLSVPGSDGPPKAFHVTAHLWGEEGEAS